MVIMYWYLLSFRTPEYVHPCLCYITMDIESIVSTMEACIVYCAKSKQYITRDLLYFIYVYTYGHILNGDGFYGHYIFYCLVLIDLHEFFHYYHLKVLNARSPFTIFTMHRCMKCMYHHIVLCIEYYACFVRNDEIKMSNHIINSGRLRYIRRVYLTSTGQSHHTIAPTPATQRWKCAWLTHGLICQNYQNKCSVKIRCAHCMEYPALNRKYIPLILYSPYQFL